MTNVTHNVPNNQFEDMLCSRTDAIYNAATDLFRALLRYQNEDAEPDDIRNMEMVAPLVDAATQLMDEHGIPYCYPFYEEEEYEVETAVSEWTRDDGAIPCANGHDCDKASCPFLSECEGV